MIEDENMKNHSFIFIIVVHKLEYIHMYVYILSARP